MAWMSGALTPGRIGPGEAPDLPRLGPEPVAEARAELAAIPEVAEAVGTVRPRTEIQVEAQVTGKVLRVHVRAGDKVSRGDVLVELEDREYRTRLERAGQGRESAAAQREQARQAVAAARAGLAEAESQYRRLQALHADKAVTARELEQGEARYLQARAGLNQAQDGLAGAEAGVGQAGKFVEEARIGLDYATVRAPEAGEVVRRLAEPGDLAAPGRPLLVLQTAGSLRLEAFVREGLISRARVGAELPVIIGAAGEAGSGPVPGVVEEVTPAADPATRTFLVKVGLPALPGVYPGMFGRLQVPAGERRAVLVPAGAVRRVGQLETVMVREGAAWRSVYVKSGRSEGGRAEILAGLSGNETVGLFAAPVPGAGHGQ
ncbi:MAG: efflux RND transporter periplasmic adaptor subunit [Thermodesulfobacteriota bacterium]